MQTTTTLYVSCTLVVLFQLFRWFGTTGEYFVGLVIVAHQFSLAYRLHVNRISSSTTVDKTLLAFAFAYHAIISGISTYSLGQLLYANVELFGAGTWMWTIVFYAPIALQTSLGIAECTLLTMIARRTASRQECGEVGAVYLPVTSPLTSSFSGEKGF